MPQIRTYEVSQTRKVKVTANNPADAVAIANAAFTNGQNSDRGAKDAPAGIWGNISSEIRIADMTCYEEI